MVLNGKFSKWVEVVVSVPQGSIIGSLLFRIYINDIVKCIGGSIRFFADDTNLFIIVDLPKEAARALNTYLKTLSHWANDWLLLFNANKILSLIFPRKPYPVEHHLFSWTTLILLRSQVINIYVLLSQVHAPGPNS